LQSSSGRYYKNVKGKVFLFIDISMSYIVLRGRWCNIIVLNVHAPTEEKGDDSKDSFYEELEGVLITFLSTI
jgi:hypothetical protein